MQKFIVQGDPHNKLSEFSNNVNELAKKENIKFGICVGDFGFFPDLKLLPRIDPKTIQKSKQFEHTLEEFDFGKQYFDIPILSVIGNHDDVEYLDDHLSNGIYEIGNLIFLHGAIKKMSDNLYVFGFGKTWVESTFSAYSLESLSTFGNRNDRKSNLKFIKKRNHFTKDEFNFALTNIWNFNKYVRDWNNDKVIFISHEAPRHISKKIPMTAGSEKIENLLNLLAPDKAYFGHYHYPMKIDDVSQIVQKYTLIIEEL